jgi:predicted nucleic acid-binding protein
MIDTNIAISAALFPNGQTAAFLEKLLAKWDSFPVSGSHITSFHADTMAYTP